MEDGRNIKILGIYQVNFTTIVHVPFLKVLPCQIRSNSFRSLMDIIMYWLL